MVGLTNDKRCLIRKLRAEIHWGFEKKYKYIFPQNHQALLKG